MDTSIKTVGLLVKSNVPGIEGILEALVELLRTHDIRALASSGAPNASGIELETASREELAEAADMFIVIGGDGTMLHAAHLAKEKNIPLVGINAGRLGFLADIPANQLRPTLERILAGNKVTEQRHMLAAEISRNGKAIASSLAVNDIVLQKSEGGRMIEFDSYVDGAFVCSHRADGLIVSTPTGSTAYALSGGGPILHPALSALVLVPICPHTLSDRPVVIDDRSEVQLSLTRDAGSSAQLVFDGHRVTEVRIGDTVKISRSEHYVTLVHPEDHDYFKLLRNKLHWGQDKEKDFQR